MVTKNGETMRERVLRAYQESVSQGQAPTLKVMGADKFQIVGGTVNMTYDHAGACKELAAILVALKAEGKWSDAPMHGRWTYALRHGAGIEIGAGARPRKNVIVPEPEPEPEPLTNKEALAQMVALRTDLAARLAEMDALIVAQQAVVDAEEEEAAFQELLRQEEEALKEEARKRARAKLEASKAPKVEEPVVEVKGKGK